jgi:phosphoglucosamine mutase
MLHAASPKFFGTDGIRGKANQKLTAGLALKVGQAVGHLFKTGNHRHKALIGKDTRLSGYMIEAALEAGLTSAGMDVLLTGPIPTPGVAMLTRSLRADIGIMISASHNPYEDNGIKIFGPDGFKLSDEQQAKIEDLMMRDLSTYAVEGSKLGRARRVEEVQGRYVEFVKHTLPKDMPGFDGMRVVLDCAHGAAYRVAPAALTELGAKVFAIGVDPDGFNINNKVGSTAPQALIEQVENHNADIGIALDGDADRLIVVDENGALVDGDQLLAIIAEAWMEEGRLKKPSIVATVMSNVGLERHLKKKGIEMIRSGVGDRLVLEEMQKHDLNLGGEQSGHIIMSDFTTTGDGLIACLQVMAMLKKEGAPLSQVAHRFEPVPQRQHKVSYQSGKDPLSDPKVKDVIDLCNQQLGENGRLLVRYSGTEPVVRIMVESADSTLIEGVINNIIESIEMV